MRSLTPADKKFARRVDEADTGPASRGIRLQYTHPGHRLRQLPGSKVRPTVVESGRVELFLSRPILAELRRVLRYNEVLAISPNMTSERIGAFSQRLEFRATLVRRIRHTMDYPRDPKDEPYIDLAATAKADYLVSRDKDLLVLMTGHSAECKRFRQITRPLRVVTPWIFSVR